MTTEPTLDEPMSMIARMQELKAESILFRRLLGLNHLRPVDAGDIDEAIQLTVAQRAAPFVHAVSAPRGCICPSTSEQTCQAALCPRQAVEVAAR